MGGGSIKVERTAHGAEGVNPGDPLSCSVAESVTPGTAKGLKTLVVLELRGELAGGLQRHRIRGWK